VQTDKRQSPRNVLGIGGFALRLEADDVLVDAALDLPKASLDLVGSAAVDDPARTGEVTLVIRRVEAFDDDPLVRIGGVNEATIADVDADMRYPGFVGVLEEYQIAGLHRSLVDRLPVHILLHGGSRQLDAGRVAQNVAREAGAIETRTARAAEFVSAPLESVGGLDDAPAVQRFVLDRNSPVMIVEARNFLVEPSFAASFKRCEANVVRSEPSVMFCKPRFVSPRRMMVVDARCNLVMQRAAMMTPTRCDLVIPVPFTTMVLAGRDVLLVKPLQMLVAIKLSDVRFMGVQPLQMLAISDVHMPVSVMRFGFGYIHMVMVPRFCRGDVGMMAMMRLGLGDTRMMAAR
jgi:hypothetical protein